MIMFAPKSSWEQPNMNDLPNWNGAKRIAIDVETCDPNLKTTGPSIRTGGFIAGIAFAIEDGPATYLPIRHKGGDNLDEVQVLNYMRDQMKGFGGDVVGANLSYDLDYLWEEDLYFANDAKYRDIQIADPLIDELHLSYSLQNIARRWGFAGKNERLLREAANIYDVDPKSGMWKLPARYVGEYAIGDVTLPLRVLRRQERELDKHDLWKIWDLESAVLPVLVKYRRRGVRIDTDALDQIEMECIKAEEECLRIIKKETGFSLGMDNCRKANLLKPILESIGVEVGMTSKGQPNIDKYVLERIDHPVGKALLYLRDRNVLRHTFVDAIRRYMVNGRIHCSFKQIAAETASGEQKGVRFGRLSGIDPNMQNQPRGAEWRRIYIPEEGSIWGCCDYSQQEPRWTTHFASISNCRGGKTAADSYINDPLMDNHQFMADLTGLPRKAAKAIFLGLCYGMAGAKLANKLKLPTQWALWRPKKPMQYFPTQEAARAARAKVGEGKYFETAGKEAKAIIDKFNERAPYVKDLAKKVQKRADEVGYIRTAGGRILHFPEETDGTFGFTYKALNRLIQGSSADQTKAALVAIDKEMPESFVQLQVHDEIDGSFADVAEAEEIGRIMRETITAKVPFRVDVEVGPSWGEIK